MNRVVRLAAVTAAAVAAGTFGFVGALGAIGGLLILLLSAFPSEALEAGIELSPWQAVVFAALFLGASLVFAVWMGVQTGKHLIAHASGGPPSCTDDRPVGRADPAPDCPNCGARHHGRFCPACGQNDRDYLRSPFAVVGQVLAETFGAHSRLWRTVRTLLLYPGLLSLEFSRNRRAQYLSPFRLYVVASVLFFFADQIAFPYIHIDLSMQAGEGESAASPTEPVPLAVEAMKGRLGADLARKVDEVIAGPTGPVLAEYAKLDHADGFDAFVARRLVELLHDSPSTAVSASYEYSPAVVLFGLPPFALMLHLLLIRRGRRYAEHLVFGIHTYAFVFIASGVWFAVVAATSAAWQPWHRGWMDGVVFLALMGYFFMAFRRFYGTGVPASLAATFFLAGAFMALFLGAVLASLWFAGGLQTALPGWELAP